MRWGAETRSGSERVTDWIRSVAGAALPGALSHPQWPADTDRTAQHDGTALQDGTGAEDGTAPQDETAPQDGTGADRRWNPGRGGVMAIAAVAVCSCLLTGWWVLSARPERLVSALPATLASVAASPLPGGSLQSPLSSPGAGAVTSSANPSASQSSGLVVDVVGKVRHPGVYTLRPGSRVADALTAAGGAAPGANLAATNLARRLTDGEQVPIGVGPSAGPGGSGSPAGSTGSGVSGGVAAGASTDAAVDLNSATATQLDALPGVGPVLAQHIVDWRVQHGRFDSVDQLNSVSGIGDAKYADLKPLVTVSS